MKAAVKSHLGNIPLEVGISAKGKNELIKHLTGKRLTRGQAILAKCYDCMGGFNDGKQDCEITECSLYPFMPYRKQINDSL